MKYCGRCWKNKEESEFCKSSQSKDGLQHYCKDCAREYMRGRKCDPIKRRFTAYASAKKYPERRRAREVINNEIRAGRMLAAKKKICVDCGKPAMAYDHTKGYENPLLVEPVCCVCHGIRSRKRGEHKNSGRVIDGEIHDAFPETTQ